MRGLLYKKWRLGIEELLKQETRTFWRKRVPQELDSATGETLDEGSVCNNSDG